MDRVRRRVKDKRVLALVKTFLKAGVMTETGSKEDSDTGTPQGGILSPLLANIALSVLDEHVMAPWKPDAEMGTLYRRHASMGDRDDGDVAQARARWPVPALACVVGDRGV
jgi:RNA-directed DNA polymerase